MLEYITQVLVFQELQWLEVSQQESPQSSKQLSVLTSFQEEMVSVRDDL